MYSLVRRKYLPELSKLRGFILADSDVGRALQKNKKGMREKMKEPHKQLLVRPRELAAIKINSLLLVGLWCGEFERHGN